MGSKKKSVGTNQYLPFIIIAGVLVVALVGGAWLFSRGDESAAIPGGALTAPPATAKSTTLPPSTTPARRSSSSGVPGAQPPHTRGSADAVVTLEEFGDFECPPCGQLYPELKKIKADFGPRLRVVFRQMPLVAMHKNALEAARASEAAAKQNRFWEMHDLLYEKQSEWAGKPNGREIFVGYARTLALDVDRFQRDMDALDVNSRIRSDVERADSLGITGTPTVLLNGQKVPVDQMLPTSLRAAIETAAGSSRSNSGNP